MKAYLSIMLAIAAPLLLMPVYAENGQSGGCFPTPRKFKELSTWFYDLNEKIKEQPETSSLMHRFKKHQFVACKLVLKETGEIADLTIIQSSGLVSCDKTALCLIRHAGPFKSPPNDLPCTSGTYITFANDNGQLWSSTRAAIAPGQFHIGEVVY